MSIDKLPDELLDSIFELGDDLNLDERLDKELRPEKSCARRRKPVPLLVSLVCSHWRQLVTDNPRLWVTRLCFYNFTPHNEAVKELVEGSQGSDIDLFISFPGQDDLEQILPFIMPLYSRWRIVWILSRFENIDIFSSFVRDGRLAQRLKYFKVVYRTQPWLPALQGHEPMTLRAPYLTHMELDFMRIDTRVSFILPNLRSFKVTLDIEDCNTLVQCLQSLRNLETLSITIASINRDSPIPPEGTHISLPRLYEVTACSALNNMMLLLSLLDIPQVHALDLAIYRDPDNEEDIQDANRPISLPSVKNIIFRDSFTWPELVALFSRSNVTLVEVVDIDTVRSHGGQWNYATMKLPSLNKLIVRSIATYYVCTYHFLRQLISPSLESLTIVSEPPYPFNFIRTADMPKPAEPVCLPNLYTLSIHNLFNFGWDEMLDLLVLPILRRLRFSTVRDYDVSQWNSFCQQHEQLLQDVEDLTIVVPSGYGMDSHHLLYTPKLSRLCLCNVHDNEENFLLSLSQPTQTQDTFPLVPLPYLYSLELRFGNPIEFSFLEQFVESRNFLGVPLHSLLLDYALDAESKLRLSLYVKDVQIKGTTGSQTADASFYGV